MLTEKGGIAADLTVSVLDSADGSTALFPKTEGKKGNNIYKLSVMMNLMFRIPITVTLLSDDKP